MSNDDNDDIVKSSLEKLFDDLYGTEKKREFDPLASVEDCAKLIQPDHRTFTDEWKEGFFHGMTVMGLTLADLTDLKPELSAEVAQLIYASSKHSYPDMQLSDEQKQKLKDDNDTFLRIMVGIQRTILDEKRKSLQSVVNNETVQEVIDAKVREFINKGAEEDVAMQILAELTSNDHGVEFTVTKNERGKYRISLADSEKKTLGKLNLVSLTTDTKH